MLLYDEIADHVNNPVDGLDIFPSTTIYKFADAEKIPQSGTLPKG